MEMALDRTGTPRATGCCCWAARRRRKIATFIECWCDRPTGLIHRRRNGFRELVPAPEPRHRDSPTNLGLTLETVSPPAWRDEKERIVQFVDRRRFRVTDLKALHVAPGDNCRLKIFFY